jgi:hypothetical protein
MTQAIDPYYRNVDFDELEKAIDRLSIFMTDEDIRRYLGHDFKIIKYSELNNYNHINQLLPKNNDCCIILVENVKNSGHFVSICRRGDIIIQFDSYGSTIDAEFNYVTELMKLILGEHKNELNDLIKRSDMNTTFNKTKYQSQKKICDEDSSICGRACCIFVQLMRMNYSLEDMKKIIDAKKYEYRCLFDIDIPYDVVFSLLIT